MAVPYYPGTTVTPFLGLSLVGMDVEVAEDFVLIDAFAASVGPGGSIEINGSVISSPNFTDGTPAPPSGKQNVTWQVDGSGNISANVPTADPAGSAAAALATAEAFTTSSIAALTLPHTLANVSHKWLNSYDASTGLFTQTQPAYTDLTGTPTLPANTPAVSHQFISAYNSSTGVFSQAQPAFSDISGVAGLTQGGTGVDGTAITANTVFAGPTSGSAGNATFRALVASDIPSLSATYLPLAGGTMTGSIQITSGLTVNWNADTGISRQSAGIVNIGNGSAGNTSGTLSLATVFASAALKFNGNDGFSSAGAGSIAGLLGGASAYLFQATQFRLQSTGIFGWASGVATLALDTGLTRLGAGSVALGNGTAGSFSGTLKTTTVNAVTGIQINGAATSGNVLRGDGTNFISAQLNFSDLNGTASAAQLANAVLLSPSADQTLTHGLKVAGQIAIPSVTFNAHGTTVGQISGDFVTINSSTATNIGLVSQTGLWLFRDQSNGGTCLVLFDSLGSITIVSQTGPTVFVTGAPAATQIQISQTGGQFALLGGSSRNGMSVALAQTAVNT